MNDFEIKCLQQELIDVKNNAMVMRNNLNDAWNEIGSLNRANNDLQIELDEKSEEVSHLIVQRDEMQREMQNKIDEIIEDRDNWKFDYDEKSDEANELIDKYEDWKSDFDDLKNEIDDLTNDMMEIAADRDRFHDELNKVCFERDVAKTDYTKSCKTIVALGNENYEYQLKLKNAKSEIATLRQLIEIGNNA